MQGGEKSRWCKGIEEEYEKSGKKMFYSAETLLETKKREIKKEMQTWDAKFLEPTADIELGLWRFQSSWGVLHEQWASL